MKFVEFLTTHRQLVQLVRELGNPARFGNFGRLFDGLGGQTLQARVLKKKVFKIIFQDIFKYYVLCRGL